MNRIKQLIFLVAGFVITATGYAQTLPEDFETLDLSSGIWQASQAEGAAATHKWSISTYAAETAQFPTNIPLMDMCGAKVLKCTTGGTFAGTGTPPDNRLISPEITVGENHILSFLMACNFAGNSVATIPDSGKTRISIYVSPDGGTDSSDFSKIVYETTPIGLNTWMPVCIDLSAFAGKTIRLQFRCYMPEMVKSGVANTLYIDNIELIQEKRTDLKLSNLTGLYRGTVTTQSPSIDITNNGSTTIDNIDLKIKVNDIDALSQTIDKTLNPGDKYTHSFDLTLSPGNNSITVSGNVANDYLSINNTLSGNVTIDSSVAMPLTMATDETLVTQFTSTRKGTIAKPAGWMYFTSESQWIYTVSATGAKAYLYTTTPLKIDKGALKVDVKGSLGISSSAEFEVFLTRRPDQFGEVRNSAVITSENNEKMLLVSVPESGDYYVAFGITDNTTNGQFKLDALTISQATDTPDLEIGDITSPLFAVTGESVPLSIEVRNGGSGTAENSKVSYTVGETTITETLPSIEGGATVVHTFATPLALAEGSHDITITVSTAGDTNDENNSVVAKFTSYRAKSLPYRESFEDKTESALWTSVNLNDDSSFWKIESGYNLDGDNMACLVSSNDEHNDWFISPAINIPENYIGRLSFYYGSTAEKAGSATIRAYLSENNNPENIGKGEALSTIECDTAGMRYASVPVHGLTDGNYYLAFHVAEGMTDIHIDDIRLDNSAEIAVTGLSVSNVEPAYDHEPSTVELTLYNFGSEDVNGAKAAYTLYKYHADSAAPIQVETVQENISSPIPAGQEFKFAFTKQITYSDEASYIVTAAVQLPANTDSDSKNNSFQCDGSQRLVTMHTPALWDMEISDNLAGFTFDSANAWKVGMTNSYDGSRSLFHLGNVANETTGDCVVLNRVHLTPGKYQLSFFWQTTRGMVDDSYKQSFDVVMGTSPADMSNVLYSIVEKTSADKKHSKEMVDVTIDTEGNYFFGFNLKKGAAQGLLAIDNVKIESPQSKYDLTTEGAVYEADFDTKSSEWTVYHPNPSFAQQWTKETDPNLGLSYMQAVEFTSLDVHYTASYLQAPVFSVKEGCTYTINIYPEFLALAQTGKPLTGTEAIVVYGSTRDLPSEFVEIGRAQANASGEYTTTFVPEQSGIYYVSLLPYCESDAAFRVHSFGIELTEEPTDEEWEDAGTCSFTDPIFSALGFAPQTMTDVKIERSAEVKNRYRLVSPYANWILPEDKKDEFTFSVFKMTPIVFDIIDGAYVYVYPFNTGWSANTTTYSGEISGFMQAKNLLDNELNFEQIIALAPGCLAVVDYDRITAPATFPYYGYQEPPVFLAHLSDESGNIAANTKGEFMITLPAELIPDPFEGWETVGTAEMTEVFVSGCLKDVEHQLLECELQQKEGKPNTYRLVNPYSSWKNPSTEIFSYDSERPRFMVIHTDDPEHAWFEEFVTGVSAKEGGLISGQCYAADFVEALTFEKAIDTASESFGTFKDNIFSFASATCKYQGRELPTIFTRFADTPNSLTRSNADNAFKVVFKLAGGGTQLTTVEFDGDTEYYNLQGQRLRAPEIGQPVIVRQGSQSYKTIFTH